MGDYLGLYRWDLGKDKAFQVSLGGGVFGRVLTWPVKRMIWKMLIIMGIFPSISETVGGHFGLCLTIPALIWAMIT